MDIPHRFVRLDPKDQSLRVEKTDFTVTSGRVGLIFTQVPDVCVGRPLSFFPGLTFFCPCAESTAANRLDSNPLRFSSMNNNPPYTVHDNVVLQQRLANAEHELAQARQKLAEIAARPPQPAPVDNSPAGKASRLSVPYVPTEGQFYFKAGFSGVGFAFSTGEYRKAGLEYPTKEAAEASLARLRQYALLLHLAADLNPSGKAGGEFAVYWNDEDPSGPRWAGGSCFPGVDTVFETEQAAAEAAKILNRDGVKPAGHNG